MTTWIYTKRKSAGLSQEDVASVLGISRPTYMKLESGEAKPTESQKDILAGVFGVSPANFRKHEEAPKVSKKDIAIKSIHPEDVEKFKQVLLYIVSKVGSRPNIGQTALYKLLYFIDFDYYEKTHEFLTGATYIKNTHGPTPVSFAKIARELEMCGELVEVKSKYFNYEQTKYIATKDPVVSLLSAQELKHIDDELERLASKTAKELSDLSHIDTPWRVAKEKQALNYQHAFYRPEETSVAPEDDEL